jgi:hypothetical protein
VLPQVWLVSSQLISLHAGACKPQSLAGPPTHVPATQLSRCLSGKIEIKKDARITPLSSPVLKGQQP